MSKLDKLRLVAPVRSAERTTLADAITAHADAHQAADKARSAAERTRGAMAAAKAKHGTAESVLNEARERAIGAVTGEDAAAPAPDLTGLRRAVADAADDVEIAREALTRAETAAESSERAERQAREAIEAAADGVLAAAFDHIYDAALAAARKMARLAWIAECAGRMSNQYDGTAHRRAGSAQCLNPGVTLPVGEVQGAQEAARAEFEAARRGLAADADFALPEL